MYVGFMDLEKAYDRVNREALWQVVRMYDDGGKLLNGINSMYVNSLACVRIKRGESECFRINSGVRLGCIMFPWLFNVYMDAMMKKGSEISGGGKRVEMYVDDLVLCSESEEDLRAMVGCFAEVCSRRGLKVNAGKRKVMVLGGEEGLEYEVCVDRISLEHVSNLNNWDVF